MAEKDTKLAPRDKDGNEVEILTGKAPRQAALKAANRCCTEITLRRAKHKNVYIYRREEAGKEIQERTCMDASQDLENQCQEGWRSEECDEEARTLSRRNGKKWICSSLPEFALKD